MGEERRRLSATAPSRLRRPLPPLPLFPLFPLFLSSFSPFAPPHEEIDIQRGGGRKKGSNLGDGRS